MTIQLLSLEQFLTYSQLQLGTGLPRQSAWCTVRLAQLHQLTRPTVGVGPVMSLETRAATFVTDQTARYQLCHTDPAVTHVKISLSSSLATGTTHQICLDGRCTLFQLEASRHSDLTSHIRVPRASWDPLQTKTKSQQHAQARAPKDSTSQTSPSSFVSYHTIPFHTIPFHTISCHPAPYYPISPYLTLSHLSPQVLPNSSNGGAS
jgi:hypothetical protein